MPSTAKGPEEALPAAWADVTRPCVAEGLQAPRFPVPKPPGATSYQAILRWFLLVSPSPKRGTLGPAFPPLAFHPEDVPVSAKSPASTSIPVSVSAMIWAALSMTPFPFQSTSPAPAGQGFPVQVGALSTSFRYLPLPLTPAR